MEGFNFHPCSELPSKIRETLEVDSKCLDYIKEIYDTDISCIMCPLEARFRWDTQIFGYCSERCANKVKHINKLIQD